MTEDEARALFSDYLDNTLDHGARDTLQLFLANTPDCAAELIAFERTLAILHRLPVREPSLDLWREFAPKLREYQAEHRLGLWPRVRQNWMHALSQLSAGVILWTHALADHTQSRLERYLLHDPLRRSQDIR